MRGCRFSLMKKKRTLRKVINTLHLWVGIPSALILFIVCLTGTVYVFQKEITRWVDSDKYKITITGHASTPMPIDSLVHSLESKYDGLQVSTVQIPEKNTEAWLFTLAPPPKKNAEKEKATIKKQTQVLIVNPYNGIVQGNAQGNAYKFFATVIEIHRWLLMDHAIGSVITGTAAFMFLLLEITGIILWMPSKIKSFKNRKSWQGRFGVRHTAGAKRINFDLHRAFGFYTFLFITIMAITGPYFAFSWYKKGLAAALGTQPVKKEAVVLTKSRQKDRHQSQYSLDSAFIQSGLILPYPGDTRLNLPKGTKGSLSLLKVKTGFFVSAGTDRIDFNAENGEVKKINLFKSKKTGEQIVSIMKAIHTGEIFGTFSKLLYFFACLLATSLPVTGIIIWLNKRRKKPAKSIIKKHKAAESYLRAV